MKTKILNVLCEGQSEQQFVSKVLNPYLLGEKIIAKPTLLITNHKLNAQGGIISYQQVKRDLKNLIKSAKNTDYQEDYFTTMIDLYALPNDFPGYSMPYTDCYGRVKNIEQAFAADINHYKFIPYIELHEFETLVLCNLNKLKEEYPLGAKKIEALDLSWRKECNDNAELVNSKRETAPSKRIINALMDKYKYNKPQMAVVTTKNKGIDALRKECAHFNQWIESILSIK